MGAWQEEQEQERALVLERMESWRVPEVAARDQARSAQKVAAQAARRVWQQKEKPRSRQARHAARERLALQMAKARLVAQRLARLEQFVQREK
jgi:hypothetical protein